MTATTSSKVLIIDDEPNDCLLIRTSLKRRFPGLSVDTVSTRTDFLAARARGPFDVVITDHDLTWSDGIQIMQDVRGLWADCSVLMYTGAGSEQLAVKALKAGLTDYIVKSTADLQELLTSIERVIETPPRRREASPAHPGHSTSEEKSPSTPAEVLDLLPIGAAWVHTQTWTIRYLNPRLASWLGITNRHDSTLKLDQFHPKSHLSELAQRLRKDSSTPAERSEIQARTVQGSELPLLVHATVPPGSVDHQILVFYEDATESRAQERRLRHLAESMPSIHDEATFWSDLCQSGRIATESDFFFIARFTPHPETGGAFVSEGSSSSTSFPSPTIDLSQPGPWHDLVRRKFVSVAQGLAKEYRASEWIQQSGVQSFVGVPVYSANQTLTGCIGLLGLQPWKKLKWTKAMLQIYVAMAGARWALQDQQSPIAPCEPQKEPV